MRRRLHAQSSKIYAAAGLYAFAQLRPFHALVASFLARLRYLNFIKFTHSPASAIYSAMARALVSFYEQCSASVAIKFR